MIRGIPNIITTITTISIISTINASINAIMMLTITGISISIMVAGMVVMGGTITVMPIAEFDTSDLLLKAQLLVERNN